MHLIKKNYGSLIKHYEIERCLSELILRTNTHMLRGAYRRIGRDRSGKDINAGLLASGELLVRV